MTLAQLMLGAIFAKKWPRVPRFFKELGYKALLTLKLHREVEEDKNSKLVENPRGKYHTQILASTENLLLPPFS